MHCGYDRLVVGVLDLDAAGGDLSVFLLRGARKAWLST